MAYNVSIDEVLNDVTVSGTTYTVSISEIINNITVSSPETQNISISSSSFPVTISYNATVIEGGGIATNGIPSGGNSGQVLAKASGDNYDVEWIDIEAGSGNMTVSESQPPVAATGDQWFRPTTQVLQVYTGSAWSPVGVDDLQY